MSKTEDGREPIDVLYNIEDKVSELAPYSGSLPDKPRFVPSKEDTAYDVLECLKDGDELTSSEIAERVQNDVTRSLSTLWKSYEVDRVESDTITNGLYIYQINKLGERAFELAQEKEAIKDAKRKQAQLTQQKDPWQDADVGRSAYFAIQAIDEISGSPRSTDIDDKFLELSGLEEHNTKGPTVGPYLSQLIKQTEYIDRTPNIPYRYWVTEQGKELLNNE